MFALMILLLERVGLIIILAYVLMNISYFKKLMTHRDTWKSRMQLCIVFVVFAVMSNLTGIVIDHSQIISGSLYFKLDPDVSLANTRVLTIGVAGLIGGPLLGGMVGLASGLFRLYMGGAHAEIYLFSSIVIGMISGYVSRFTMTYRRYPSVVISALIGALMEIIQMLSILIFSDNKSEALSLVLLIALPMIVINSLGTAIFMAIIVSTLKQEEQLKALQTHDVLELVNQTLPYFKKGLNPSSAKHIAYIIKRLMKVSAVAIIDREILLAHVGPESEYHNSGIAVHDYLAQYGIQDSALYGIDTTMDNEQRYAHGHLQAAITIPLKVHTDNVGTLILYFENPQDVTYVEQQLATGLAQIFSSQLELGEAETQTQLLKDAEIKSLQAQVSPHFFFNAINTISALIRIDSEKARDLLLKLSHFFRANIQGTRHHTIILEKELNQVAAYLSLEQARYPGRVEVKFDIADTFYNSLVPPFLIQILVENAMKHAFGSRKNGNLITVSVTALEIDDIRVAVEDNGQGIPPDKLTLLGKTIVRSNSGTGSALENLNRRLIGLFGDAAALHFDSRATGTTVWCIIPYQHRKKE